VGGGGGGPEGRRNANYGGIRAVSGRMGQGFDDQGRQDTTAIAIGGMVESEKDRARIRIPRQRR